MGQKIPILLLKTRSTPGDAYEELFSTPADGFEFKPAFVPVLEHAFDAHGMERLRRLLQTRSFGTEPGCSYGGLIFTSQRAVEAFAKLVADGPDEREGEPAQDGGDTADRPHLDEVPVYSVGPTTTRALRAVCRSPPLRVFGEHTGNGDKLARFILDHYGEWHAGGDAAAKPRPPLLFAVGEQRRDVIPRMLMGDDTPASRRIRVDELVVYGTGVMASFRDDLARALGDTADGRCAARWVVVFSPTGCDGLLRGLGLLDEATGRARKVPLPSAPPPPPTTGDEGGSGGESESEGQWCRTYVATIGPTTRDYLVRTLGFEPDVCSQQPSPEGVWRGIVDFMRNIT